MVSRFLKSIVCYKNYYSLRPCSISEGPDPDAVVSDVIVIDFPKSIVEKELVKVIQDNSGKLLRVQGYYYRYYECFFEIRGDLYFTLFSAECPYSKIYKCSYRMAREADVENWKEMFKEDGN